MNDLEVTAPLERAEACYRRFCEAVQALRASLAEERTLLQTKENIAVSWLNQATD